VAGVCARLTPDLSGALARLEAAGRFGIVPGLGRTRWLLDQLGSPDSGLPGVLVAGTNGKGSVAAMLESMARAGGHHTALLAKPHLVHWGERIVLDGVPLGDADFAALAAEVLDAAEAARPGDHPTQFEMVTAMSVLAARRHGAGVVVCEVGMGGARDSTNVLDLGGCVITNVDLDHREWLGDTIPAIAAEKAGILKPGDWAVTAAVHPALAVIEDRARACGVELESLRRDIDYRGVTRGRAGVEAQLRSASGEWLEAAAPLPGEVQIENLAVAMAAARRLGLDDPAIVAGAAGVRWPGRLQWVDGTPPIVLDGAHNPAAMARLRDALPELVAGRRVVGLFGAMKDKQLDAMLPHLLAMTDDVVLTSVETERAAPAFELATLLSSGTPVTPVSAALARARTRAGDGGVVLVCGSLAVVGAVLAELTP
jgi:dihydrofolate synthase/folylpolyglutamate synthase